MVLIFKIVTRLKVLKELLTYFALCTWSFQLGLCQNAFSYTGISRRGRLSISGTLSSITSFLFDIIAEKYETVVHFSFHSILQLSYPSHKFQVFNTVAENTKAGVNNLGGLPRKEVLSFGQCSTCLALGWGGGLGVGKPVQIDFDTFFKVDKLPKLRSGVV